MKPERDKILVFGDSNTWGYAAGGGRLPQDCLWPTILANHSGLASAVVSNGECGRMLGECEADPNLDGAHALKIFLENHPNPALLVIMLGTNDLLNGHTLERIAEAAEHLLALAVPVSRLLVAPPKSNPHLLDFYASLPDIAPVLESVACKHNAFFLDAGLIIPYAHSADGVHLSVEDHALLAEAVGKKIGEILGV